MISENGMSLGISRTGLQMSPQDSKRLLENARSIAAADPQALAIVRKRYIKEADPLGSVSLPSSIKSAVVAGARLIAGQHP